MCVLVMGSLLAALIPYVTQARNTQAWRLRRTRAEMAAESLVQQIIAEAQVQPIVSGSTRTLTLNKASATATVTDGSATISNSNLVVGTTTLDGQTFKFKRYVTSGVGSTPYNYAVFSDSDMVWAGKLATGAAGANGDVFCNGKIDLQTVPGSTINGNISATKKIDLNGTVTGSTVEKATAVPMPTISALNYQLNASVTMNGPQTITTGASFSGVVNGHYPIYIINGDVSFQGTVSGMGVVFINGNVTFTGNVAYANSSSRVAVIATGNFTIGAACSQAAGIFYVGGSLIVNSPDFNMAKGSIIANTIASGPIIRATRDNFMQTSSAEGTKLCLPGYWP